MNADGSIFWAMSMTLPISSRVTTQKRMSWSAPVSPAAPLVDRHPPAQHAGDGLPDRITPLGDDGDRGVLLDAVEQEVERLRRGDVGEDRVEGGIDAQEERGRQEDDDVQAEDALPTRNRWLRLLINSAAMSVPSRTAPL